MTNREGVNNLSNSNLPLLGSQSQPNSLAAQVLSQQTNACAIAAAQATQQAQQAQQALLAAQQAQIQQQTLMASSNLASQLPLLNSQSIYNQGINQNILNAAQPYYQQLLLQQAMQGAAGGLVDSNITNLLGLLQQQPSSVLNDGKSSQKDRMNQMRKTSRTQSQSPQPMQKKPKLEPGEIMKPVGTKDANVEKYLLQLSQKLPELMAPLKQSPKQSNWQNAHGKLT